MFQISETIRVVASGPRQVLDSSLMALLSTTCSICSGLANGVGGMRGLE
ncbi:MAG: hypothetical protein U0637_05475 [Phycisphaerales bacterium]